MAAPDPVTVNGDAERLPGDGVLIVGLAYSPGADATIFDISASVAADNVIMDGVTYTLPFKTTPTPVLIGGQKIAKALNGGVVWKFHILTRNPS